MKSAAFIYSGLLVLLALIGYFGWEAIGASKQSGTALIPLAFGIPIAVGGVIAQKNLKLGMHIAALFGLLGLLAAVGGLAGSGFELTEVSSKLVASMGVICLFFTVGCVRSFIAARRGKS